MSNPFDSTIWTLFLIAFYCMLRKSNLIPTSSRTFDHTKQLCRSDLMLISNMLVVNIKWSKTIQSSERVLEIPLTSVDSPLCPVTAFKNMFPWCLHQRVPQPSPSLLNVGSFPYLILNFISYFVIY